MNLEEATLEQLKMRIKELNRGIRQGDLFEVTDEPKWPEYPDIKRFHSFDERGIFHGVRDNGEAGYQWEHYRKIELPKSNLEWVNSRKLHHQFEMKGAYLLKYYNGFIKYHQGGNTISDLSNLEYYMELGDI